MSRILVTGAAGFIGFHLSRALLKAGHRVVGLDSLNDYYDPALKQARLALLKAEADFHFVQLDLAEGQRCAQFFAEQDFDQVVHLAAQAGVRHSIDAPHEYIDANLQGFANVLEGCRQNKVAHLVFASSSSVYGLNQHLPFRESDLVGHPVSLYGASKRANELMAHSYAQLYGLPTTGLRFFTVYGPWGRPDMAYFSFCRKMLAGEPIEVFNRGQMKRDFTYVDDVVAAIVKLVPLAAKANSDWNPQQPDAASSLAPFRIYNVGNDQPVALGDFIDQLESLLQVKAKRILKPMQPGDVQATWADVSLLRQAVDYRPNTGIREGLSRFVDWYLEFYK